MATRWRRHCRSPRTSSTPRSARDLMAYYLATVDAAFKSRLAGPQRLAETAQRLGRSGGRDHGDEGDAAAPADLPAQARGL